MFVADVHTAQGPQHGAMTAPGGKIPKDLSWNQAKKMMGNVDGFLNSLIATGKQ